MQLNLGCGSIKAGGYVNVDRSPRVDPDQEVDLTKDWPWDDNSIDDILALDLVEHLSDVVHFMEEAHRVLKVGAKLTIRVVHYLSRNLYIDPTHVRAFHEESFDFFCPGTAWHSRSGYYSTARFRMLDRVIRDGNVVIILEKIL